MNYSQSQTTLAGQEKLHVVFHVLGLLCAWQRIVSSEVQPIKTSLPTASTDKGIFILLREVQFINAQRLIAVTPDGIVTFVREVQFENARSAIS